MVHTRLDDGRSWETIRKTASSCPGLNDCKPKFDCSTCSAMRSMLLGTRENFRWSMGRMRRGSPQHSSGSNTPSDLRNVQSTEELDHIPRRNCCPSMAIQFP